RSGCRQRQKVGALDDGDGDLAPNLVGARPWETLVDGHGLQHRTAGQLGYEVLTQQLVVLEVDVEIAVTGEPGIDQELRGGGIYRRLHDRRGDARQDAQHEQGQHGPRPTADGGGPAVGRHHRRAAVMSASTTGTVLTRILKSVHAERWAAYSMSIAIISWAERRSRPDTCQGPVIPGFTRSRS